MNVYTLVVNICTYRPCRNCLTLFSHWSDKLPGICNILLIMKREVLIRLLECIVECIIIIIFIIITVLVILLFFSKFLFAWLTQGLSYASGLFHCYTLDGHICRFEVVGSILLLLLCFLMLLTVLTLLRRHIVVSDLGLHCVSMILLRDFGVGMT